jgi:hypothetical protein
VYWSKVLALHFELKAENELGLIFNLLYRLFVSAQHQDLHSCDALDYSLLIALNYISKVHL